MRSDYKQTKRVPETRRCATVLECGGGGEARYTWGQWMYPIDSGVFLNLF